MSRLLAAKGVGACPSMFSTPGSRRHRFVNGRSDDASFAVLDGEITAVPLTGVLLVTARVGVEEFPSLSRLLDGDPLPPEDRVLPRRSGPLDHLYRSHAPRLLRFFSRRAERQDAADLVQDAFVRYAEAEDRSGEPFRRPDAYLAQVAANVLRNRARAAFYRAVSPVDDEKAVEPLDLAATLEARDELNRMQSAMQRLSPKTREIFMAHRLDGATYAEIAQRMGLSIKGVEWHMTKALRQLHRALDGTR